MKRLILTLTILASAAISLGAQNTWAVKTNLLHDIATLSPNVAVEYAFDEQMSVELALSANYWRSWGGSRLNHLLLQPEVKYWFCEKYDGWFVSATAMAGLATLGNFLDLSQFHPKSPDLSNFLLKDAFAVSLGIGGGYDFILSRHWNLEVEGAIGYMYARGDEYDDSFNPPDLLLKGSEFDYVGPTKLAVSIVYLF